MACTGAPPVTPGPRAGTHPLSHQQEGLLAQIARLAGRHRYEMALAARLRGPVDTGRLTDALAALTRRHPALQTVLRATPTGTVQHVDTTRQPPIAVRAAATRHAQAGQRAIGELLTAPVPLLDSLPYRFVLAREPGGCLLLAKVHHLVFDAWSWGLVLNDLASLYANPASERGCRDGPLAYSDYARWQHDHVRGAPYHAHLAFWRQLAAGYPPDGLPLSRHPVDPQDTRAAHLDFSIPPDLTAQLTSAAQDTGATLFILLLAVFTIALACHTGLDDVLLGTATANRRRPEVRGTVGFFANGRYLRTGLRPAMRMTDVVAAVRDQWTAGHAHQELHLEKVLTDLGLPDLVNVKFSCDNALAYLPAPHLPGGTVEHLHLPRPATSRRHLDVAVRPQPTGGLAGRVTYRTAALDQPAARALASGYLALLRRYAHQPATPLDPLLTRRHR